MEREPRPVDIPRIGLKAEKHTMLPLLSYFWDTSGGISATDCGAETPMTISETDFAYRLDRWDTYGGNIIHHIAIIDDLELAMAAYEMPASSGRARPSRCGKAHASLRPPPFNGRTLDRSLGVDAK